MILESYWALVIGQTVGRIVSTGLSFWVHPYRPRPSLAAARDLFHFSKWMLLLNLVQYVKDGSANWVIGRFAGPASLGAFTISYEIATLPSSELVAPINRAVFPAYAKLAREGVAALRQEYLSVIGIIVLLATPAVLGVAATSPALVLVMLGPNWTPAIPVLTLMAFFGYTHVIQSNAQAAYLALGRVDIPAKLNSVNAVIQLAALIPLTKTYGVIGAAFAYLLTAAVMIPASLGVVLKMLRIPVLDLLRVVWRPIAAAAVMYAGVARCLQLFPSYTTSAAALPGLISAVTVGAAIYLSMVVALWLLCGKPDGAERIVFRKSRDLVSRIYARWALAPG